MEENIVVMKDPKTFYFYFDWPKDVEKNLKHETEYIIEIYESLVENKIKKEIRQLLLRY